jgi:hypothetical protein
MITFPYTVRPSFLKYSSHPITVPKAYYRQLESEDLAVADASILIQNGSMRGTIYAGNAGWGHYYQIRARGETSNDAVDEFATGQRITVVIEKAMDGILVTLGAAQ